MVPENPPMPSFTCHSSTGWRPMMRVHVLITISIRYGKRSNIIGGTIRYPWARTSPAQVPGKQHHLLVLVTERERSGSESPVRSATRNRFCV